MRLIAIVGLFALIGSAAQADIMCTRNEGCWETGQKIVLDTAPINANKSVLVNRVDIGD